MINCIVAIEEGHGIGYQGYMPWPRLPNDMHWFKTITTNQIVIMGSVTWGSLGKPLPNRINIVLSKNNRIPADHCFSDIDSAIEYCYTEYPEKEIFIIGGDSIYKQCMPKIDTFYITEISAKYECDRFFNFDFVTKHKKSCRIISTHTAPVEYTIKEYKV